MSTFAEEYARLNDDQKKAVDTIEGPVMVVAGPGTGKTQVLSLRVANILERTQVSPRNILCLTFTNAGTTAMRERLRKLIGAPAYNVTINTIHGFCNDIIAQHPHVFENYASLEQISDVDQYRAINKIIDDLLPDLELVNRKSPYTRTKDILGRISDVKREGKTIEELREVANAYEIELSGKSKEGTKAHEKNLSAARKFHDFVTIFEKYQEMLVESQRYDYNDMILTVLRAFKEEDWMLEQLQQRYLYIHVDEFQDTNGAQYKIIENLITPRTAEDFPNIFIVGDDDQAIYRFQGANLQNIMSFHHRFPKAPVVVLKTSYRCSQSILNAAGTLIANNTERLVGKIEGLHKDLISASSTKDASAPELLRSVSDVTEPWMIADLIEEELKAGTPLSDIAILTQKNAELRPLYDVLKARSIPVLMDGKISLLDHPLVKQAISILHAIQNLSNGPRMSSAIAAGCFACHSADLGRLFSLSRELEKPISELLIALDDPASDVSLQPWHQKESLIKARDVLFSLQQQLENRTLIDTLEHVFEECNLLPTPTKDGETFDPLDFAALQAFFEYVKARSYEVSHYEFQSLMNDIELFTNDDYNLHLSYTLPHLTQEGVQLLTAHQSKGLEYEVVILTNFRDGHWDKKKPPASVSIPEDLLFGWQSEQKSYERDQDERRVAYVAMTRAKRRLIFTCPLEITSKSKPQDVSPSGFFVEAGTLPERTVQILDPTKVSTLLFKPVQQFDEAYKAFLHDRLKDFRLSVTALNNFLEDPMHFVESDLLRKPQILTGALVYGNAVHQALKMWNMSVQDGLPLSKEQFMREFAKYLDENSILTNAERINLQKQGEENLPRYYEQRLSESLPIVYKVEFPINTNFNDVPLKGKIDRIDLDHPDGARATIVDFKTGKPKSENAIREDGDYFRQLAFYSILMEYGMPMYEPVAYVLDFVGEGTDHPVQRTFTISKTEKNELKTVIEAVWKKIINLDFTPL